MSNLLFSVNNPVVQMDGYLGSFDVPDADYSCDWVIDRKGFATIDVTSIRRQVWRKGKPAWVVAQLDAPVIDMMEARLQAQVEREADEVRANVREVARGYG